VIFDGLKFPKSVFFKVQVLFPDSKYCLVIFGLRVDLNPFKKKATSFQVRNVMIDFPTLFFEMVPKTCQGSFFLPALA